MTGTGEQAAWFTGTLWAAILEAGGPRTAGYLPVHFAGAFDTGWLASLPVPLGDDRSAGQPVALLDPRHTQFERHTQGAALAVAYATRHRTQVLEDIAAGQPGAWYALASRHLTRLSGSDPHVTCSVFASRYGDETFGAHRDTWYGAVVQVSGAKDWQIGEALLDPAGTPPQHVRTRAGDILLIPKNLAHIVTTPPAPGHSVHLAFAICRDTPDQLRDAQGLPPPTRNRDTPRIRCGGSSSAGQRAVTG